MDTDVLVSVLIRVVIAIRGFGTSLISSAVATSSSLSVYISLFFRTFSMIAEYIQ